MPDSTLSSLSNIRTKIRRLTRNPSTSQISDVDINSYINNFILYDMPATIKLNSLKTVLSFYTTIYTEIYSTNTVDPTDPLYNFKNKYTNVQVPVYVAGEPANFSQSKSEFYGIYPLTQTRISLGTGDGITKKFTGILSNVPILQNNVIVTSLDAAGGGLLLTDDGVGGLEGDIGAPSSIAYIAGTYDITFAFAPGIGEDIWINTLPYTPGKPISILYTENEFIVRPVPNGIYRIDITVLRRPTEMEDAADLPELSEWWEYISYGSAIKILQDRLDMETVQLLMPEFKHQEILIGRRKIIQNAGKRSATIFSGGLYENNYIGD